MAPDHVVCVVGNALVVRGSLEERLRSVGVDLVRYETVPAFQLDPEGKCLSCIVLDVWTVDESTIELLGRLRERGVVVIVTTPQADIGSAVKALKNGAVDFLERPVDDEIFLGAINSALAGRGRFAFQRKADIARRKVAGLTPRERNVLEELMAGRISKQIAFTMRISVRTVEVHRAHMLRRLGVRSLAEAIALAVTADLGVCDDQP
jgi:two-component system response regulator FixJ